MSLQYLLDTNALSAASARRPDTAVLDWMREYDGESATGAPVLHEMMYGYLRLPASRRRSIIETYVTNYVLSRIPILPYDTGAATWHAAERARLVSAGRTPPYVDGQIAAIAVTNGLTLVTANTVDFQHFTGLRVIDWRL